jgi:AraC family transcriptional activator of pobA
MKTDGKQATLGALDQSWPGSRASEVFDTVGVASVSSWTSPDDFLSSAARPSNLYRIMLVQSGEGDIICGSSRFAFTAPSISFIAPMTAYCLRFKPPAQTGWALSFTQRTAAAIGIRRGDAAQGMLKLAMRPVFPLTSEPECDRLWTLCAELEDEVARGRVGFEGAARGYLALIIAAVIRLADAQFRDRAASPIGADCTGRRGRSDDIVEDLRSLIEENFRDRPSIDFYANKLNITRGRLNEHVMRVTGVAVGNLIRLRVLSEAKERLALTNESVDQIARDLAFRDTSHFGGFFRRHVGATPREFQRGRFRGQPT